jgi:hypothetical protein
MIVISGQKTVNRKQKIENGQLYLGFHIPITDNRQLRTENNPQPVTRNTQLRTDNRQPDKLHN